MSKVVCLETQDGETFVNLEQVCQSAVTPDNVDVWYSSGKSQTFTGGAAHQLIQALRHEERVAMARSN